MYTFVESGGRRVRYERTVVKDIKTECQIQCDRDIETTCAVLLKAEAVTNKTGRKTTRSCELRRWLTPIDGRQMTETRGKKKKNEWFRNKSQDVHSLLMTESLSCLLVLPMGVSQGCAC